MNQDLRQELAGRLGPRARFDEPMSRHTTWGVGGPAWCLARVADLSEMSWLLSACQEAGVPVKPLGRGSNLLVTDQGFPGVMVRQVGGLAQLRVWEGNQEDAAYLICGGGASLPVAVRLSAEAGLSGLEWAVGIPATVGGAVATNAGAMGIEMAHCASRLTLVSADGRVAEVSGRALPARYRRRELPAGSLVVGVELELRPLAAAKVLERRAGYLAKRLGTQPLAAKTAGSVFKNPPGDFAGRLIEAAGLKGAGVGGARISPRHANFIENTGQAQAAHILELMAQVVETVRAQTGVELEPEVEVIGHA